MPRTILQAITQTAAELAAHLPQPLCNQEARWMIQAVCALTSTTDVIMHHHRTMTTEEEQALTKLLHQRLVQRMPLGYLLGSVPFCELAIATRPPVLIPRLETEEWVDTLIARLQGSRMPLSVADVGTGSGCIALALAYHLPHLDITGYDISPDALLLACDNSVRHALTNVMFFHQDILDPDFSAQHDIIVANPPYLSRREWDALDPEVKQWESHQALVAGESGIAFYQALLARIPHLLHPQSHHPFPELILEIGAGQRRAVSTLLHDAGFFYQEWYGDMQGKERVVFAARGIPGKKKA